MIIFDHLSLWMKHVMGMLKASAAKSLAKNPDKGET